MLLQAVRELAPAGDRREVHTAIELEALQFLEPGARREVRSHAHDAGYLRIAACEAHDRDAARDEGLAQFPT